MGTNIYDKYGFTAINNIVHDFYGRVLQSDITAPYFVGIDMQRVINHQTQFLCSLVGGPVQYQGHELERMHNKLAITDDAFDEIVDLLDETLEDHDLTDGERTLIIDLINQHRDQIVTVSL